MLPIGSIVLLDGDRAKVQRDIGGGDYIVELITGNSKGDRRAVNMRHIEPLEVKVDRSGVTLKAKGPKS